MLDTWLLIVNTRCLHEDSNELKWSHLSVPPSIVFEFDWNSPLSALLPLSSQLICCSLACRLNWWLPLACLCCEALYRIFSRFSLHLVQRSYIAVRGSSSSKVYLNWVETLHSIAWAHGKYCTSSVKLKQAYNIYTIRLREPQQSNAQLKKIKPN